MLVILIVILLIIYRTLSNTVMYSENQFISHDAFRDACDLVYKPKDTSICKQMFNGVKIFVDLDDIDSFEQYILPNINHKFTIVSKSNKANYARYSKMLESELLIKWFSTNVTYIHSKLIPTPLGCKWQYKTTAYNGEPKDEIVKVLLETNAHNADNNFNTHKDNLLFVKFDANATKSARYTNHTNHRQDCITKLKKNGIAIQNTDNFAKGQYERFKKYMLELKAHKFTASPPGHGIDCHRTWEALMM